MKNKVLDALESYFKIKQDEHIKNVNSLIFSSEDVGHHSNLIETIESEIEKIVSYENKLLAIKKHFKLNVLA